MVDVKPRIGELFESNLVEGGRKIRLEIVVRKPEGQGPFPVVIFNHGSTGSGKNKRFRKYALAPVSISNYFNDRGWMVVFPQRRGRGKSDGLYDEGFEPDRTDVVASRMIIAGVSRGGILAITCAGQSRTRFLGAINFSGGWLGRRCRLFGAI